MNAAGLFRRCIAARFCGYLAVHVLFELNRLREAIARPNIALGRLMHRLRLDAEGHSDAPLVSVALRMALSQSRPARQPD